MSIYTIIAGAFVCGGIGYLIGLWDGSRITRRIYQEQITRLVAHAANPDNWIK